MYLGDLNDDPVDKSVQDYIQAVPVRDYEGIKKYIEDIKSGQKDAWITPFYNGKRILLEDLFKVNFYGKSIN